MADITITLSGPVFGLFLVAFALIFWQVLTWPVIRWTRRRIDEHIEGRQAAAIKRLENQEREEALVESLGPMLQELTRDHHMGGPKG
ncbi:MAG TPA: hypothetical protein VLF21_02325 [Candidatus Saccharimonadales bacterium]|nr:hypothetical protein [Candidatus Saccharimonadales bacterium]